MTTPFNLPPLGENVESGTVVRILVSVGDALTEEQGVLEIETDKATMEVEAVDEGIIGKILIEGGTDNVKVNDVIAVLLEEGESKDDIDASKTSSSSSENQKEEALKEDKAEEKQAQHTEKKVSSSSEDKNSEAGRIFASPLAKRIAADKGINLSQVEGSGPRGRIIKADLEGVEAGSAKKSNDTQKASSPSAETRPISSGAGQDARKLADAYGMEYELIPNNNVKKITAKRLLESKQTVPHFYLTIECRLDGLLKTRKQVNEDANGEYKVSVNDFVIKAVAQALKAYPAANVAWGDEAVLQFKHSDVSVAVATPNGLITPIVKAAETKGLRQISEEVKDMAGRAREGKLKPEEFQGGTFSVSNLGMFGISEFGAIINPPQACILAVGAGEQKPYVEKGEIKIGTFMKATLSVDHRAVDGAVGAEFLSVFKRYIENPINMIV